MEKSIWPRLEKKAPVGGRRKSLALSHKRRGPSWRKREGGGGRERKTGAYKDGRSGLGGFSQEISTGVKRREKDGKKGRAEPRSGTRSGCISGCPPVLNGGGNLGGGIDHNWAASEAQGAV